MNSSDFSTDEKINLVKGMGNWHTNDLSGKMTSIHLADGPHGLRAQSENAKSNNDSITANCFPTACASACSFDRKLINEMAAAIADEAKSAGVSVVLGPGVNIKRSPLCGRNFEYFSEDPFLAGELATAYVKGVQENGVATSLKHFAGNSQETHRMTSNSMIDERALREIYLRAFEKTVKNSSPATIMASYNMLNGKPACENRWLLTDVLRNEWGFEGLVMSDWGACVDAGSCIEAGMDLEMPDSHGNHTDDIKKALADGRLSEEALDKAVNRVCRLVSDYGYDDNRGLGAVSEKLLSEYGRLAEKVCEKSAVLLKNENVLPLDKPDKVIVVGTLAEKMRVQGGGSSHIKTRELVNAIDAFKACGVKVEYYKGYDCNSKKSDEVSLSDKKLIEEAVLGIKSAAKGDSSVPVIVFGGLTDTAEGEGYDRETLLLPENQRELYRRIKEVTDDIIYVSFGGAPYDMSDIIFAKGIISMYLGGEGAAEAAVNILLGKCNPSGRLSETWPLSLEDTPCYEHFGVQNKTLDDVHYTESIFVGYRYYDTFSVPVRFPFGHGLSYTTFKYSNMKVVHKGKETRVSVDVTNAGQLPGEETVLVFVKNPESNIIRAGRELRGFDKIWIDPGKTESVEIVLDDRSYEIFDKRNNSYVTVPGTYSIEISESAGKVIISEDIEIKADGNVECTFAEKNTSYFPDSKNKDRFRIDAFKVLFGLPFSDFSNVKPGGFSSKNSLIQMAPYSGKARLLLKVGKAVTKMMTGAPLDDPESRMIYGGICEGNIDSVCNQSGGIIKRKMINRIIKQANK